MWSHARVPMFSTVVPFSYNRNSGTGANDAISKANGLARPVDILQQFGGSLGGPVLLHRAWFFVDYEQQLEKNPITAINPSFLGLDQTDFGVADGVQFPAPNAPFPVPGTLAIPDPNNPAYLQGVANALTAIQSNLGVQPRYRNDWSLFSKIDYRDSKDDRFYLNVNWNRFDSPSGFILGTQTALFGKSTLANAFVRDYQANAGWSHAYGSNLLNEVHAAFSRDDQYSTPTGTVNPALPTVLLLPSGGESGEGGTNFQLGNAGFAGGRTHEALWQLSDRISYLRGKHTLKFGVEFARTHLTGSAVSHAGGRGFESRRSRQLFEAGPAFSVKTSRPDISSVSVIHPQSLTKLSTSRLSRYRSVESMRIVFTFLVRLLKCCFLPARRL